jgi:hypothetical protein
MGILRKGGLITRKAQKVRKIEKCQISRSSLKNQGLKYSRKFRKEMWKRRQSIISKSICQHNLLISRKILREGLIIQTISLVLMSLNNNIINLNQLLKSIFKSPLLNPLFSSKPREVVLAVASIAKTRPLILAPAEALTPLRSAHDALQDFKTNKVLSTTLVELSKHLLLVVSLEIVNLFINFTANRIRVSSKRVLCQTKD